MLVENRYKRDFFYFKAGAQVFKEWFFVFSCHFCGSRFKINMLYDSTFALKDLEVEFHYFYEISRILTKHNAHYEAESLAKKIQNICNSLTEENVEANTEPIISIHNSALEMCMNFLSMTLKEGYDLLVYDLNTENHFVKSLAKSHCLITQVILSLKQYHKRFFHDLFYVGRIEAISKENDEYKNYIIGHQFPLSQDDKNVIFESLVNVRTLMKYINSLLKFTKTFYMKDEDDE